MTVLWCHMLAAEGDNSAVITASLVLMRPTHVTMSDVSVRLEVNIRSQISVCRHAPPPCITSQSFSLPDTPPPQSYLFL